MTDYLRTPDTPADTLRDTLLGACGPCALHFQRTQDREHRRRAQRRAASGSTAGCPGRNAAAHAGHTRAESTRCPQLCHLRHALPATQRTMTLPGCAVQRPAVRQRKLRLLQAVFRLAAQHPDADVQLAIYRGLFAFSEDWDEELLDPVIAQTEKLCRR